jgi:small-conductance mechanosensitive channel
LRRLSRIACAVIVLSALWTAPSRAAQKNDRVAQLQTDIHSLETLVASSKDSGEKSRLETKLNRLRQEVAVLEQQQEIEEREHALVEDLTSNPLDALREKLRSVDQTSEEAEARIRELAALRQTAVRDRNDLQHQIEIEQSRKDSDEIRLLDLQDRLETRNEELRALALKREAAEDSAELAHEADRLREELKSIDTHRRPSLRALFESYSEQRNQQKIRDRLSNLLVNLDQNLVVSQKALELSQQNVAKFDEELGLLQKQRGFFSNDERTEHFINAQRARKKTAIDRIPLIADQVDAIKRAKQAVLLRQDLLAEEAAFQQDQYTTLKNGYLTRLRWPVVALVGLVVLFVLSRVVLLRLIFKNEELFLAYRLARYIGIVAAVSVICLFLFDDLSMVAATLGVVSAALVISLQDVCTSVFGWFVIMMGGKFGIGDRLEIDGTRGDVIDIQLLRTTLLEVNGWLGIDQPTGRVIVVPNNFIFRSKVFNFSHGHPFIWGKIDITVTFNTKVPAAMALFQQVLEEETREEFAAAQKASTVIRKKYGVDDAVYIPKIYTHIADSGVTFSLFYVADYHSFSATRNRINRRLIDRLDERPDIQLAYNTVQLLHGNAAPGANMPPPPQVTERTLATPPLTKTTASVTGASA